MISWFVTGAPVYPGGIEGISGRLAANFRSPPQTGIMDAMDLSHIRALIFDLDGTLIDSERDLIESTTLYQARVAAQQVEGSVSRRIRPIKEQLLELIALLEAGIDVISTVNIQHLESVNDVVEAITGIPQRETVPDSVVRAADQVELVDMTPEALRRRMAHGNIYAPGKVDAALGNYFRTGNLTALRELALLWLADKVDEGLQHYRHAHDIRGTWEARERVVVALTGGPEGETLIRRAARIASSSRTSEKASRISWTIVSE